MAGNTWRLITFCFTFCESFKGRFGPQTKLCAKLSSPTHCNSPCDNAAVPTQHLLFPPEVFWHAEVSLNTETFVFLPWGKSHLLAEDWVDSGRRDRSWGQISVALLPPITVPFLTLAHAPLHPCPCSILLTPNPFANIFLEGFYGGLAPSPGCSLHSLWRWPSCTHGVLCFATTVKHSGW